MNLIRLNMIVEGQTEEEFVNQVLRPHLLQFNTLAVARTVSHVRRRTVQIRGHFERRNIVVGKGGLRGYEDLHKDILRWTGENHSNEVRFTTMVDFYAYPEDAPKYIEAQSESNPYRRVALLEQGMAESVNCWRFIPYIQLHEFETILYSDIEKLAGYFLGKQNSIDALAHSVSHFGNIELINDNADTAPSKRILNHLPEYDKVTAGSLLAMDIGLVAIRQKCRHFDEWLRRLESLSSGD